MTEAVTRKRPKLNALQGLRGIAALLVVADHTLLTGVQKLGSPASLEPYAYVLGAVGVQIFFAISGFVMIQAHGSDFGETNTPYRFASRRLTRIVPLYWLISIFFFAKEKALRHGTALSLLAMSMLFIPHQEPGEPYGHPFYPLGWTLEYEMLFYLVFAVALFFRKTPGLVLIFSVFIALMAARGIGFSKASPVLSYYGSSIVIYFLVGMGFGLTRENARLGSRRWGFAAALYGSLASIAATVAVMLIADPLGHVVATVSSLAVIAVIALCSLADERDSMGGQVRVARALGDATYSIYLTHTIILGVLGAVLAKVHSHLPLLVAAAFPATIAVGMIVYRYIEKPSFNFASALSERLFGARVRSPIKRGLPSGTQKSATS